MSAYKLKIFCMGTGVMKEIYLAREKAQRLSRCLTRYPFNGVCNVGLGVIAILM